MTFIKKCLPLNIKYIPPSTTRQNIKIKISVTINWTFLCNYFIKFIYKELNKEFICRISSTNTETKFSGRYIVQANILWLQNSGSFNSLFRFGMRERSQKTAKAELFFLTLSPSHQANSTLLSTSQHVFFKAFLLHHLPFSQFLLPKISITSDMQMTPPLWQKVKRNSKASWWKWKWRVKKLA